MKCEICGKDCKNAQSLSNHIGTRHKDWSKEEYYLQYLKINDNHFCPVCGNITPFLGLPYGFQKHCSAKCAAMDENTKLKRESTNRTIYGTNYNFQNEEFRERSKKVKLEKYGDAYFNREKSKLTLIIKYGVDNPSKSKEIQDKITHTSLERYNTKRPQQSKLVKDKAKANCQIKYGTDCYFQTEEFKEKSKQTSLLHYGVDNPAQSQEIKNKVTNTCLERYGVPNGFLIPEVQAKANSKEAINKMNMTKRKNKTFNTSKQEDIIYEKLISIFGIDDVKHNYSSTLYPFSCDFYIKSLDMYIELNLHWTHGKHFFDKNNNDDLLTLQKWQNKAVSSKYYKNAINVWTNLDIKKKNTAIQNKLNYITLWNIDDVNEFIKNIKN